MKKLMISMGVALLATFTFANANSIKHTPETVISVNQDKVEVKPEDLPEAVRATLGAAPYNEWKIEKAYQVPGENESQYFEINLSKGEETSTVKLDKDGKVIN